MFCIKFLNIKIHKLLTDLLSVTTSRHMTTQDANKLSVSKCCVVFFSKLNLLMVICYSSLQGTSEKEILFQIYTISVPYI